MSSKVQQRDVYDSLPDVDDATSDDTVVVVFQGLIPETDGNSFTPHPEARIEFSVPLTEFVADSTGLLKGKAYLINRTGSLPQHVATRDFVPEAVDYWVSEFDLPYKLAITEVEHGK